MFQKGDQVCLGCKEDEAVIGPNPVMVVKQVEGDCVWCLLRVKCGDKYRDELDFILPFHGAWLRLAEGRSDTPIVFEVKKGK